MDPAANDVIMISFPRDIAEFPLYGGGTFKGKINSLMTAAASDPKRFPDGPLPTLANEVGYLLGIPINYFAAVDLDGFQKMIKAVGGVTVNVNGAITDPKYDWLDGSPRLLSGGRQAAPDPANALAYVRSRYGAGDNDFTRAARQQQLLVALRAKLTDPANLGKLPACWTRPPTPPHELPAGSPGRGHRPRRSHRRTAASAGSCSSRRPTRSTRRRTAPAASTSSG